MNVLSVSGRARPLRSVRMLLLWLVLACLLPAMLGALILFYQDYQDGRAELEKDTLQKSRSLMQIVDAELSRAELVGQALADSSFIDRKDFAGFHERARKLLVTANIGSNIVLSDVRGQQIVNTLRPFGELLPVHGNLEQLRRVMTTGKPAISGVFVGGLSGAPKITVDVPVLSNGNVVYVLSVGVLPAQINEILLRQQLAGDWVASVFDGTGTVAARLPGQEKYVGKKVNPGLIERITGPAEGTFESRTKEGIPAAIVYSRSPVSHWSVAIAIPRQRLEAGLIHDVCVVGWYTAILFAASGWLAWFMGGRISRSIQELAATAKTLGSGQPMTATAKHFREAAEVAAAMQGASRLLLERQRALRELNDALEIRVEVRTQELLDLYDQAPCGYHSLSPDGVVVRVNKTELALLGYAEEEFLGHRYIEFLTRESAQTFQQNFPGFLETGKIRNIEFDLVCKDGSIRPFLVDADLTRDASGQPLISHSSMVDNTERKAYAEKLKEMNGFLQGVLEVLPFGVLVLDKNRQALLRNNLFGTLLDYPPALAAKVSLTLTEMVRFNCDRGDHPGQSFDEVLAGFNHLMDTRQTVCFERRQANGSCLEIRGQPISTDWILLTYTDITTHKLKEQSLEEAKNSAEAATVAVDSFAYAVSHDLRAPLRAMSGFSHILMKKYGPTLDDQANVFLNQISIASEKMGQLIEGILTLSRAARGKFKREPIDISALATRHLDEMTRGDPSRNVDWRVEPGLMASGDKVTVEALLGNLLGNAWKYTGKTDGASIRVHAGTHGLADEICVTDNGAGFDMAHAEQLFQPFRRLHRQDEFPGIGIGLATVQRIVHRHGGVIHAEAVPNGGATFCFTLSNHSPGAPHEH